MELTFAAACEDARARPDGKLDLSGIFNELTAPGFPAVQDRLTVVFVLSWDATDSGEVRLRADLNDDEGQTVLSIEGHTDVTPAPPGRPPAQTRLVLPLEEVVFPHAGRYTFEVQAGDRRFRSFSLYVSAVDEDAGPV